jgi:hypothetical protein
MKPRYVEGAAVDARATLQNLGLWPVQPDFHTLPASKVDALLAEADRVKYRKPRNANGSRGRYFYAMLCRRAGKRA